MTTITTEQASVHFTNGRSAALGESLGFRRWLTVIDGARAVGEMNADYKLDSEAFKSAMADARLGYLTAGTGNSFDKSATYLRKIRVAFPDKSADELVKDFQGLNRAYSAAQRELAPKDADGNRTVTDKSADEREGEARAAIRRALCVGVSQARIDQITAEEVAKLVTK